MNIRHIVSRGNAAPVKRSYFRKVKKICVAHIINFKNGNVTLERNIEYNYAAMKSVMAECHIIV